MRRPMITILLCLGVGLSTCVYAQSNSLNIDFSATGGAVEDDYEGYYATHEAADTFTAQTYSAFGATITVTPTWAAGADNTCMQMIDRGSGTTTGLQDLLRDWIGSDTRSAGDPLTLTISGLPAGKYNWLSYHHDRDATTMGLFDVTVNDMIGSVTTTDIQITGDAVSAVEDVAVFTTEFTANGTDDVTFVFDMQPYSNQYNEAWFLMNGFEIELISTITSAEWPTPEEGQTDVALNTVLSWNPGIYAVTHDIYFGTDFDDVNDATRVNPGNVLVSQNQTGTTYIPDELDLDGVYYWRVDEVNEDPSTIFKGHIWSFSAEPIAFAIDVNSITATASSSNGNSTPEQTINESGLTDDMHSNDSADMWITVDSNAGEAWIEYQFDQPYTLHEMIIWNCNIANEAFLGFGIKEALIEVSADGNEWTTFDANALIDQASALGTTDTGISTVFAMDNVEAQAVRITALSNWSLFGLAQYGLSEVRFTTIPTAARLPQPEDGATDVATSEVLSWRSGRYASLHEVYLGTDVNDMILVDSVTAPEYAPTDLVYDQSYVWTINEVNESTAIAYDTELWSFSTPAYRVIDDMESYDNENYIFDTWMDGYDDQGDDNSSQVGLDDPPYVEQTIVYAGNQSLPMYYTNSNSSMYATAVMALDGEDWTEGGLQTLTLFFRGDISNEGGQLYVQVNNKKVTHDADLSVALWSQWNIDLDELGIDLTDVTSLTIGVDGVGSGLIYIDEIRLYRDIDAPAEAVDPGTDNLIAYYSMESSLNDQSGNGYHGTSENTLFYSSSYTEAMGQAVSMDGVAEFIDLPLGNLVGSLENSCFAVWVSIDPEAGGNWMRAFDFGTGTDNYLFLCPRVGTAGAVRLAILTPELSWETGCTSEQILSDGWHHLAGVFDTDTLSLYVDSQLVGSVATETYPQDLGVTTNNWLGKSQWDADDLYQGLMDEFRIYDRALTAGEVRYLAEDQ